MMKPNSRRLLGTCAGIAVVLSGWVGVVAAGLIGAVELLGGALPYVIVDTGQERCYDQMREIAYPAAGASFHGQDAQYRGREAAYVDHGDGTVSDENTGLMWQQNPGSKKTFDQAVAEADQCRLAGRTDWRLPTIKELYSLIRFDGIDPDPTRGGGVGLRPFIDNAVFKFQYGKEEDGDRIIDSQFATSTRYVSATMGGNETMFGLNFADGRIKGYPTKDRRRGGQKTYYVLHVRGNPDYGKNVFKDNGDGTVSDQATGLTWTKADSGRGMIWADALAYAENLDLADHSDWRLPNAKELQSIVDYARSPGTTGSAAIDPVFIATAIDNELGEKDFPAYWSSTTHVRAGGRADAAVYVAFGRAMGCMRGRWMDVHGAGCQRSDPKDGDPADYPEGRGPQGDAIRILNFVRCVRGGAVDVRTVGPAVEAPSGPSKTEPGPGPGLPPGASVDHRPFAPQGFVQRLDRDGDGKVSKQEFDGPPEHFRFIDRDGDGFLVESEAPPPPPRMRRAGPRGGGADAPRYREELKNRR